MDGLVFTERNTGLNHLPLCIFFFFVWRSILRIVPCFIVYHGFIFKLYWVKFYKVAFKNENRIIGKSDYLCYLIFPFNHRWYLPIAIVVLAIFGPLNHSGTFGTLRFFVSWYDHLIFFFSRCCWYFIVPVIFKVQVTFSKLSLSRNN